MDESVRTSWYTVLVMLFIFLLSLGLRETKTRAPVEVDVCAERIPLSMYHHEDDKYVYCVYDEQLWQYDKE